MKAKKRIPRFGSEDAERDFWAEADSTDYVDWSKAATPPTSRLRPTLRTISLRLPEPMLAELKLLAHKRDVPYQSLLKMFLLERIERELRKGSGSKQKA
jgi:predicted DNA binding CopG/RHH family protein